MARYTGPITKKSRRLKTDLVYVTQFYFDGVLVPSVTADPFQLHQRTNGGSAYPGTSFEGYLAEVLVYDRAIDAGESLALKTYLADKYGIAPEPASLGLLALGAGAMLSRRRRA
jgi:hypothetical protein